MGARIRWFILLCVVAMVAAGCKSSKKVATNAIEGHMASLYNPSRLSLHPDYSIFHENNNYSVLYIRAYPAELRFNEANPEAEYRALLQLRYELIRLEEDGKEGVLTDSASVVYKLLRHEERSQAFFASLTMPVRQGQRYLLRVETRDLNRGSMGLEYIYVDKSNPYGAQNFKVISMFSGYPKFMRFFLPGEQFNVRYRNRSIDTIFVNYFKFESELPRPPITATSDYTLQYTPDTSFVFPLVDTANYNLRREGMYHIQIDPERDEGLALLNFGGSFPEVKTPDELMEPLFYLTTLAEYRDLRKESNRKLAVDNFWLKTGNNMEKSRELLRIFYNRVVYSNLYFTSNKEGWKTDQGMIFILFGPPSRIQMTGTGESWFYFAKRKSKAVEFKFQRQHDAFSLQNLVWTKSTESQVYWNEAVRSWKNGKVYSMGS